MVIKTVITSFTRLKFHPTPLASFPDKLISGKKARRHQLANNALSKADYRHLIQKFSQPDYELWDTDNDNLVLVWKTDNEKAIKISLNPRIGGKIVSAFKIDIKNIIGGIKGGQFTEL